MATNKLTNEQKRDYAKTLYFHDKTITNKELAHRVGCTEKTIGNWIREGEWEILRRSMILSKSDQIARLYIILDRVTTQIEAANGIGDTKLADMMIKYTAATKNLETDTSLTEVVESLIQFGQFIQRHYPEHYRLITDISDAFVQEKLA